MVASLCTLQEFESCQHLFLFLIQNMVLIIVKRMVLLFQLLLSRALLRYDIMNMVMSLPI